MKKRQSSQFYIISLIFLFFNLLIIMFPNNVTESAKNGALLWYRHVLPSLFPFIFGVNMLIKIGFTDMFSDFISPLTKELLRISGQGASVYITGICSGYPIGAKMTAELLKDGSIEKSEAQHLITFCNNSGPLFIIGTVGSLFEDTACAYIMLFVHILSSLTVGFIFRGISKPSSQNHIKKCRICSFAQIFSQSITDAGEAVIKICGYIMIFSVISGLVSKTFIGNSGIFMGFLEMTNGCGILSKNKTLLSKALACALISWGGLSIHAQTFDIIGEVGLSKALYIFSKMIQAVISFFLFYGIYYFLF